MTLEDAISLLEKQIENSRQSLPDAIFQLVSRLTPMLNVDLLIVDSAERVLLTWCDNSHFTPGWHIPGGAIRTGETIAQRIAKVASQELKTMVKAEETPTLITEFHYPELPAQCHSIALLYRCRMLATPGITLFDDQQQPAAGQYAWFDAPPPNLLEPHWKYQKCWRR